MTNNEKDREQAEFFDQFYAQQSSDNKRLLDDWLDTLTHPISGLAGMGQQSARALLAKIVPLVAFSPVRVEPVEQPSVRFTPLITDGFDNYWPARCRCGGEMRVVRPGVARCSNCDQ